MRNIPPPVSAPLNLPLQLAWTNNVGANLYMTSPLIHKGKVIVASVDEDLKGAGHVYALNGEGRYNSFGVVLFVILLKTPLQLIVALCLPRMPKAFCMPLIPKPANCVGKSNCP